MTNSSLIMFPDYEKLKNAVDKLRGDLPLLILELDELRYVECKNLETAYVMRFGALEHKAYKAQTYYLRLKRKINLIQAKINRQEKIDQQEIEEKLEKEFIKYKAELDEQIRKMNEALERSKSKRLSKDEAQELKKCYRNVVKELHPDLHPTLTPEQIRLFKNAVDAYKNGDLATIKMICVMVQKSGSIEKNDNPLVQLKEEKARLETVVHDIHVQMDVIKMTFPYTEKETLSSAKEIAQRKQKLEKIIADYDEAIESLQEKIQEMLVMK